MATRHCRHIDWKHAILKQAFCLTGKIKRKVGKFAVFAVTAPRKADRIFRMMFGVSVRTIQRDILEIEATFHVPLDVRCGKYDGGVFVVGDYSFDRAYMHEEELALLSNVQKLVKDQLSEKENALLSQIIKIYTKAA